MLLIAAVKAEPAKADFTSTVKESIQKMKNEKLIEHEMQKDADAYKRAWEACERGVTPYVVANLKADCADLQEYFHAASEKEDLRQPVPVKTANELVAMASATNETFHATLRPLVGRPAARIRRAPSSWSSGSAPRRTRTTTTTWRGSWTWCARRPSSRAKRRSCS